MPNQHTKNPKTTKQRLMQYCDPSIPNACWEWTGYKDAAGYGKTVRQGKPDYAHRVAYETFVGPIPAGLVICHKCDNPPCINPAHLIAATQGENVRESIQKGRRTHDHLMGENNYQSKLTEASVREMRRLRAGGAKLSDLAVKFGVNKSSVCSITKGRNWAHIKE